MLVVSSFKNFIVFSISIDYYYFYYFCNKTNDAMKVEFTIWLISYLIKKNSDIKGKVIKEWSEPINEDIKIHRYT